MSRIVGEFCLKSLAKAEKDLNTSKSVVIEGFANKAVVDRGNDYIPPEAWKIEEFQKNPILFFNHDRNVPIGRALDVKVTTEGLKIKAKISKSKASPMPYIRDMIREQVLRTFSVGFDPMGSEEKREDGVNVIKQANLLEVSVVSIPMNQESDFTLAKSMVKAWRTKDYDSALSDVFLQRGDNMLARLHEIISSRKTSVEGFDRTEVLETLAAKLGIGVLNVESILAGQTDLTDEFISAFGSVFMVPKAMLKGEGGEEDKGDDEEDKGDEEGKGDEEDKGDEGEKQAAGLDAAKDDTDFGNPHLTIAKSHLALAGSMVDKLCSVEASLREMTQILKDMAYRKDDQEIMPVDDEEAEDQAEEVAEDGESADNGSGESEPASEEDPEPASEEDEEPEDQSGEEGGEESEDDEESEDGEEDETAEQSQKRLRLIRLKRKAKIIADFERRIGSL